MIDKETYKKELIRMFASFRHDKAKFEYCLCSCEQCKDIRELNKRPSVILDEFSDDLAQYCDIYIDEEIKNDD